MGFDDNPTQAELDRAIAASMEDYNARGAMAMGGMDDDAQLAAILEASKHDR